MQRIVIVGLSTIGLSIAFGLKQAKLPDTEIVGTSSNRDQINLASRLGATDSINIDLNSAVSGAEVLILDVPTSENENLLKSVGPLISKGSVVTDTGISKVQMVKLTNQYLPQSVSFVGGRPLLRSTVSDFQNPSIKSFEDIPYCITTSKSTDPNAVRKVISIVEILGAKPFFLDTYEHDSYSAIATLLPVILSASLANVLCKNSDWGSIQRILEPEIREIFSFGSETLLHTIDAGLAMPDPITYWIDEVVHELKSYQTSIRDGDKFISKRFDHVLKYNSRLKNSDCGTEKTDVDIPPPTTTIVESLLGKGLVNRYRRFTDKGKSN